LEYGYHDFHSRPCGASRQHHTEFTITQDCRRGSQLPVPRLAPYRVMHGELPLNSARYIQLTFELVSHTLKLVLAHIRLWLLGDQPSYGMVHHARMFVWAELLKDSEDAAMGRIYSMQTRFMLLRATGSSRMRCSKQSRMLREPGIHKGIPHCTY
jgi:hypothetical protein